MHKTGKILKTLKQFELDLVKDQNLTQHRQI